MWMSTDEQFAAWDQPAVTDSDLLAEFAGRACYQSWSRPNPETRANADYIKATVAEKSHESIVSHASATYYITGVSRNLTHEMLRHRWLAFSEMSQRYVWPESFEAVIPPALDGGFRDLEDDLVGELEFAKDTYEQIANRLVENGFTLKQAREAARAVLPGGTETRIVVTGNLRAWRDFIGQRYSPHADAEIRELAYVLLCDLRRLAPATFADIPLALSA
ncbi:FAD-dependent thymidylate synthase [Spirillospora sp. NPDC127200]